MALIDRIRPGDENVLSGHEFSALLYAFCNGDFTKAVLQSKTGWDASDEPQIDALKAHYDGLGTDTLKMLFLMRLQYAYTLWSQGHITEAQFKTGLGM